MFNFIKNALLSLLIINNVNANKSYQDVIDYELMYSSDIFNNNTNNTTNLKYNNNLGFSNGLIDNIEFNKTFNYTLDECKDVCNIYEECVAIFRYKNNSQIICNYLSYINQPSIFNFTSNSYFKVKHHKYGKTQLHSIKGTIFNTYEIYNGIQQKNRGNTTLYLDLNHNGVLEHNEPSIIATFGQEFIFDNVSPGIYLIKQVIPDKCYQIYPGLYGNHNNIDILGDGYIDNVMYFYEIPHKNKLFYGGNIEENMILNEINYSYVIGNDNNTYLTFYPSNSIILSFVDETIIDNTGDDIYIELYNNTFIAANVSISHNNKEYYHIGILNNETKSFDISNSREVIPLSYIKLDFYNDENETYNKDKYMNIVSIKGNIDSLYKPSFGYYINVPNYKSNIIFYNDCHYILSCKGYCLFNTLDLDDYASCIYGCKLFETTNMCNCNDIMNDNNVTTGNSVEFTGINYDNKSSLNGCYLAMKRYLYPNYTLFENSIGYSHYEFDTNYTYDNNLSCINNMLDSCSNENCSSFSLDNHNSLSGVSNIDYMTYYKPYYKSDNTKNMIIKNTFLDILDISTSTSTTTTSETTTTTSETTTTTSETTTTTSETTTTTSETTTTTSETTTTTSETTTTTSETTTTTSETTTTTSETSIILGTYENIKDNKNDYLYYTIPICVLGFSFFVSMIVIVIMSCKNTKNKKKKSNIVYQYDNPIYADSDNNIEVHNDHDNDNEHANDNPNDNDRTNNPYKGYYYDTRYDYLRNNGNNNHINNESLYQLDYAQPSDSYLEILGNNKKTTDL